MELRIFSPRRKTIPSVHFSKHVMCQEERAHASLTQKRLWKWIIVFFCLEGGNAIKFSSSCAYPTAVNRVYTLLQSSKKTLLLRIPTMKQGISRRIYSFELHFFVLDLYGKGGGSLCQGHSLSKLWELHLWPALALFWEHNIPPTGWGIEQEEREREMSDGDTSIFEATRGVLETYCVGSCCCVCSFTESSAQKSQTFANLFFLKQMFFFGFFFWFSAVNQGVVVAAAHMQKNVESWVVDVSSLRLAHNRAATVATEFHWHIHISHHENESPGQILHSTKWGIFEKINFCVKQE